MSGIYHEWNGTVLTITSDSGTSSADLKGDKGDTGIRGAQGYAGRDADATQFYDMMEEHQADITAHGIDDLEARINGVIETHRSELEAMDTAHQEQINTINANKLDKTAQAVDSALLGGKAPEYYSNPINLLDNSYWKEKNKIINQRGQTTYTTDGYTIDRWCLWVESGNLNFTVNNGYISLSFDNHGTLYQRVEKGVLNPSKTYTLAYKKYNGGIEVKQTWIDYEGSSSDVVNVLDLRNGEVANIEWVALYEGEYTLDTLPEYQYKGYTVELAECMRYFIAYNFAEVLLNARVFGSNPKYADITLPTSEILRTNPTVINNLYYCAILVGNTGWEGKITSASASGNMVNLVFETNDGTDMIASTIGNCRMIGNFMLSADL